MLKGLSYLWLRVPSVQLTEFGSSDAFIKTSNLHSFTRVIHAESFLMPSLVSTPGFIF